jgi:hypothetical protein
MTRQEILIEALFVAHVLNLCGKLTPEVAAALNLLLSRLGLPPIVPEPRRWNRRNGRHVTAALALPSIVMEE